MTATGTGVVETMIEQIGEAIDTGIEEVGRKRGRAAETGESWREAKERKGILVEQLRERTEIEMRSPQFMHHLRK